MNAITTQFENRPTGFYVQVGDAGRLFEFEQYKGRGTYAAAVRWFGEQLEFQHRGKSFKKCRDVVQSLFDVAAAVRESFPTYNRDFRLHIDEHLQTVVAVFGSIVVSVAGEKFNVELIVNWLTKERRVVCDGVGFDTVVAIVANSENSQTYEPTNPDALHLSELNRYVLTRCFSVSN